MIEWMLEACVEARPRGLELVLDAGLARLRRRLAAETLALTS